MLQELADSNSKTAPTHPIPDRPPTPARVPASSTERDAAGAPEPSHMAALQADLSELRHKFKALDANFKIAKAALRKRVREREGWASRAMYLERLISTAEKKHGIQILELTSQSPRIPAPTTAYADAFSPLRDLGAPMYQQPEEPKRNPKTSPDTPTVEAGQAVANEPSESTQGDTDEGSTVQLPQLPTAQPNSRILIKQEPSSDEPLVVSERVVRKRKRDDLMPTRAAKAEPTDGSSPILSRIHYAYGTQENVDLGDIEQRIVTPRKQKGPEQSEPACHTATRKLDMSSATHSAASARHKPLPQPTTLGIQPSALTPLSVNVQRRGPAESKSGGRPPRRDIAFAISAFAEDGDVYGTTPSANKNQCPAVAPTSARSRLHTLLNSPSAATSDSVLSRPISRSRERDTASEDQPPVPQRRRLPFNNDLAQAVKSPRAKADSHPRPAPRPNENRAHERSPPRRNKKQPTSSLRAKPPSELRLEDFKINPLANDGHDFAFADVVRHKGERACLPGCTDLHCCGKQFRALALSQRPDPPLTPAQRIEEQSLLEEYLGDRAYRLARMGKEERAELWVEAKTQELANKYGKHRHRFSRMQSPPGFWNADFPSTQELEEDRAEAAKRERQAIAERHREAMRSGGRWLFKDE